MTPDERMRSGAFALLLLLAGCAGTALPLQPAAPIARLAPGCSVGANGGPIPAAPELADRGIGGTGAPRSVQTADRGIGGTGIIGVITGFASICLGGQEVGYDDAVPILLDGRPGTPADLRAGQLALVDAAGPDAGLLARRVLIRHEVTGPVQSSLADPSGSHLLRVAGQRVAIAAATLGDTAPAIGAWVAVSGFRDPDGIIHATRIDGQVPGEARIAGPLVSEDGHLRIGTAEIVLPPGLVLLPGRDVVVVGRWSDGVLHAVAADPDLLLAAPAAFFGPGVATLVIESYAGLNEGRLVLGRLQQRADGQPVRRAVIEFARGPNGALQPASTRELGPGARGFDRTGAPSTRNDRTGAPTQARRFEPAPIPQRGTNKGIRTGSRDEGRAGNRAADQRTRGAAYRNGDDTGGGVGGPGYGGPQASPAFGGQQGNGARGR